MNPAEEEKSTLTTESSVPEPSPVVLRREAERILSTWRAPSRVFVRRDRKFYTTIIAISALLCLILFVAEGVMPVILIASLLFLYFVLTSIQPDEIEYKITSRGVKIADKRIDWPLMGRFWFTKRNGIEILNVETAFIPGKIDIVIDTNFKEEIRKSMSSYLPEEEVPPTSIEKTIDWFSKKLPGNY